MCNKHKLEHLYLNSDPILGYKTKTDERKRKGDSREQSRRDSMSYFNLEEKEEKSPASPEALASTC
jgi:hypothetical protein